jgi:hypothetical protein
MPSSAQSIAKGRQAATRVSVSKVFPRWGRVARPVLSAPARRTTTARKVKKVRNPGLHLWTGRAPLPVEVAGRLGGWPAFRHSLAGSLHDLSLSAPSCTKWFQPGRAAAVLSAAWCRRNPMSQRIEPALFASSWRARQATGRCNTGWCGRSQWRRASMMRRPMQRLPTQSTRGGLLQTLQRRGRPTVFALPMPAGGWSQVSNVIGRRATDCTRLIGLALASRK